VVVDHMAGRQLLNWRRIAERAANEHWRTAQGQLSARFRRQRVGWGQSSACGPTWLLCSKFLRNRTGIIATQRFRDVPRTVLSSKLWTKRTYSITSSARVSSVGGSVRPKALAVVKLTIKSNLVGCATGISPGLVPRKILSTYSAVRQNKSGKFGP